MATDMWTMINRELAKIEGLRGGASNTPYLDVVSETMKYAKEDRAWKERKNLQRQQMMSNLAQGTGMTFNNKDLKLKKERLQNYYNKYQDKFNDETMEYGSMLINDMDIQHGKNRDFELLRGTGELLQKDIMRDMQNLGVDEDGKPRTLNELDYDIITETNKKWIDHVSNMRTNFGDRLSLEPYKHIDQGLTNGESIGQFLLLEAREDDLFDDVELKAYMDSWKSGKLDAVNNYNQKQAVGKRNVASFNVEQIQNKATRYTELDNFINNRGILPYTDPSSNVKTSITYERMKEDPSLGNVLTGLEDEYDGLPQQLENLNSTHIKIMGTDFLKDNNITFESDVPSLFSPEQEASFKALNWAPKDIRGFSLEEGLDIIEKQTKKEAPPEVEELEPEADRAFGITDKDMEALGNLGIGIGVGAAAYQAEKIAEYGKKLVDVTARAGKYINKLTKLSPSQITEFLESDKVGDTLKKLNKYEKSIKKGKNKKQIQKLINETKNKSVKYWSKRFGVKPDVIAKLYKEGTTGRWNLWRAKAAAPKAFGRLGGRYVIGSIVTDALGFESEGAGRVVTDISIGYATEKAVVKKFLPQLIKMIKSPRGQKYLAKVVGKKAAQKIVTSTAAGTVVPYYGNIAMALIGTGLAAVDIYSLVKNWEEEPEKEE